MKTYNVSIEDRNGNTIEFMPIDGISEELMQRAFLNDKGINTLNDMETDSALPLVVSAYRQMSFHPGVFEPRRNKGSWTDYERFAGILKDLCMYLIDSVEAVVKVY